MRPALLGLQKLLARDAARFRERLVRPQRAQRALLVELTASLAETEYGRAHGVRARGDLRARLPIVDADTYRPWLERQRREEGPVITPDEVLFYEKTSGSSGAAKYIPYTAALRRSFSRMFARWAHDLLRNGPRFRTGKLYFSVSPTFSQDPATAHGVPVGLADDSEYLDRGLRFLFSRFLVGSRELASIRDPERFQRRLAELLLAEARLEVISVWSPSFLKVILDLLAAQPGTFVRALGGRLSPARARALEHGDWRGVWPELKLVSCWASAASRAQAERLGRELPGVLIQGKGLLATEAPLSFPLLEARGFVPLVDEVYYELEDEHGGLYGLHEVVPGREYQVILTQRGGLYRYRIGDVVRVTHFFLGSPCLEFVGRTSSVSDLVGEKLHESFVEGALERLGEQEAFSRTLVPCREPRDHYVLLLDRAHRPREELEARLDEALSEAHHYRHARSLGQLAPARVVVHPKSAEAVAAFFARRGVKWGDVKPRALLPAPPDAELSQFCEGATE